MSMLCSLYRLTAEQANAVQTFPDAASELLGSEPIPSNRDIDEVSFLSNRQMKAEQRKLPGESKYPIVS